MRKLFHALAAAALLAAPAFAQAPKPTDSWKPETFQLPNGMTAVVLPDHRAPVVTHMLWFKVGQADEVKGKSGLAHFLEHLMFKATDEIKAGDYSKIVARNGGQDNAATNSDVTYYHFRVAKDRLPQMMAMEADRMQHLKLEDSEVIPERHVVQEERRQSVDSNPGSLLFEKIQAAMYAGHPYAIPVIGNMSEVEKLTPQDARDWYHDWYGPENAILVVAGDITAKELEPLAKEIYGPIPKRGDLHVRAWPAVKPIAKSVTVSHSDPKVRQPDWMRHWLGVEVGNPDSEALTVGMEILGGGRTSRLYRELVEPGKAVMASAYSSESQARGMIGVSASPGSGVSLDEIRTQTLAVTDKFIKEGPTEDEVKRAKKMLIAADTFARDNQMTMAEWYGSLLAAGRSVEWIEASNDRVKAVTVDQVKAAVQKYMTGVNYVDANLLPGGQVMRKLLVAASFALLALGACDKAPAAPAEVKKDTSALADIQVVTSPGGVTAWLVSESFVPIIAVEMAWKGGASIEPQGKDGLGWVLGYMMNEGAGELDTTAYGARMEDLNMSFGCSVWSDWTSCGMSTLTETADDSFEMLRLAFAEPRFDQQPIDRAKAEYTIDLREAETEPKTISGRAMLAATIPGHPYARYASPETVATITRDDVVNFKNAMMTKDRLIVVVVGDITAEELKPKLDQAFGSLPATSTLPTVTDAQAKPAPVEPIVKQLPIPQTLVTFSGPGLKRTDPDFYAAVVLNYILGGGGFSSRLTDDIREKKGLTYGIGTNLQTLPHFWRWGGSSSTKNESAKEVVRLIKEHIAKLGAEGPTQKELDDAKAYLTGAFPLNFDSNAKIAKNLMGFRQDDLGVDYVATRNDLINAVTLDDMNRVAAAYMKPENFTFVMVGQPK